MPSAASIRLLLTELREERLKKARMGLGALNHHATMVCVLEGFFFIVEVTDPNTCNACS